MAPEPNVPAQVSEFLSRQSTSFGLKKQEFVSHPRTQHTESPFADKKASMTKKPLGAQAKIEKEFDLATISL